MKGFVKAQKSQGVLDRSALRPFFYQKVHVAIGTRIWKIIHLFVFRSPVLAYMVSADKDGSNNRIQLTTSANETYAEFRELEPSSSYRISVVAVNAMGASEPYTVTVTLEGMHEYYCNFPKITYCYCIILLWLR